MRTDTTPAAEAVRVALYRRLGGSARVSIAAQMSNAAREITLAGIRSRHPDYNEAQARWALFRLLLGDSTFSRVWPAAPHLAP